jgi:RNA polymerase sigma factor (TIGR02999 family)
MPLVYSELRRIAASRMRRERADHTLQPTALVNEAYLRLVEQNRTTWKNRAQFFAIAAEMMRRILINHALARQAEKRGGGAVRVTLDMAGPGNEAKDFNLLALDQALKRLAALDERKSRIVELKFFAGLSIEEIAQVMELSHATVERDWKMARSWIHREIT